MKILDSLLLGALAGLVNRRGVALAFTPQVYNLNKSTTLSRSFFSTQLHASDKARILFLGTPDVAATSLTRLVEESKKDSSTFEVVGVVTKPPKRRERRGKVLRSPVNIVADELEIPVLTPENAEDDGFLTELEEVYKPDLCIRAAYAQFPSKRFLKIPKLGTLNIHPSLLPRWRGTSPVQRSLEAGDNPVGVSVLFTNSVPEAGPIVRQAEETIDENDDASKVLPHLFNIGDDLLIDALPEIIKGETTMETALEQDEDKIVNADLIHSSEAELFFGKDSARTCHNKIRGFSMWPGTFIYVRIGDNEEAEPIKLKILQSRVFEESGADPTDEVVFVTADQVVFVKADNALRVVCADGSILELLMVQPATKKAMDARSFANGRMRNQTVRWVKASEKKE